jgi:hypothetical protein
MSKVCVHRKKKYADYCMYCGVELKYYKHKWVSKNVEV